ncbi:excinuclease ABC subunit UvrA [Symbiobacterium terraclitae]|uniref:excinuclease ABC subunit UvrA n=1 Tax=Symbiobacterium terraclitae TaxID=557451 RepID=UPI0035B53995
MPGEIVIHGARTHNLKNVTVRIPKEKLVVITGPSGSGKSALVLDTLDKEGQRQYMEALGWFSYGLARPPVDRIEGLAPTVSVDQHLTNRTPRSTVGTETDIYTYLRVLFAKIGHRPCPGCGRDVAPPHWTVVDVTHDAEDPDAPGTFPCPHCGAALPELSMAHFSFNKVAGACPTCTGLGVINQVDVSHLIDESRSVREGAVRGWVPAMVEYQIPNLLQAAAHYGFTFDPDQPVAEFGPVQRDLLLHGVLSPQFRRHFPGVEPPATARAGRFEGVVTNFMRRYAERIGDARYREKMERHMHSEPCPDCGGSRLRAESRAVTVAGRTIVELAHEPLTDLADWVGGLTEALEPAEWRMAQTLVNELRVRIRRVLNVGVGYLTLDRAVPSLSGGEAQRLRLAALLGSELSGVIYVLDEPTVGLHQRDTHMLVEILRHLRDLGNTVVVIEHDLDVIRAADHVIDIGPAAGRGGGSVVAAGTPEEVARVEGSPTGRFLAGVDEVPLPPSRRTAGGPALLIRGARAHNLKDVAVRLPLGALVAVTGVSGSGKSTLVFDVLGRAARRRFTGAGDPPGRHDGIDGWEHLDRVVSVDQEPIARRAGSNVATYTDVFAAIRKVYAGLPYAREHGLTERHFSFNVPGGRCEKCQGAGVLTVSMHFLPAAEVRCPACRGRRFKEEVLGAQYRGCSIADVLEMTVAEALEVFARVAPVRDRLTLLAECGLGYLTLGQPATTLSGGEAQRVKLARELGRRGAGRTLFLLDEPSQGLHPADTARLVALLQRLVDAGHSVVVVEHNLDVVKAADWVIDLGPEGGAAGGCLVAEGTPEQVAACEDSHTGRLLRPLLTP